MNFNAQTTNPDLPFIHHHLFSFFGTTAALFLYSASPN